MTTTFLPSSSGGFMSGLFAGVTLLALLAARFAHAEIDLRVEAWPRSAPIEAFVLITRDGAPVAALAREEFQVALDEQPIPSFDLRLPASADPAQNLSIVFVQADGRTMGEAIPMIEQMAPGDRAAAVRAAYGPDDAMPQMRIQPFTPTDGTSGTAALLEFLTPGMWDQAQLRYGSMVPHEDWLAAGLAQFEAPGFTLPPGPAAVVMQGNGRFLRPQGLVSQSDLVARANALGIPVFTLATADMSPAPAAGYFLSGVAAATGGRYFTGAAYETIHHLLDDAYQLVIPSSAVVDCGSHTLQVTVRNESTRLAFDRCDHTPDPLIFDDRPGVPAGSTVVSNVVSVFGIDTPADVSVIGGEYSLGCGSVFTTAPGVAVPGERVCVRHVAANDPGALNATTLVVGGVGATFYSSTAASSSAEPQPAPTPTPTPSSSSGGGGAFGVWDIVLMLLVLLRCAYDASNHSIGRRSHCSGGGITDGGLAARRGDVRMPGSRDGGMACARRRATEPGDPGRPVRAHRYRFTHTSR